MGWQRKLSRTSLETNAIGHGRSNSHAFRISGSHLMKHLELLSHHARLVLAIVFLLSIVSAHGATLVVTTSANSGAGSLRNAVAAASGGDTIEFAAALSGQTIVLTGGLLRIEKDLTLDASALDAPVAVSGNNTSRVFEIATVASVVIDGLIIKNGSSDFGGGVTNRGDLILRNCTVTNNRAVFYGGGIANLSGKLTLIGCTVVGNSTVNNEGGGIWTFTSADPGPARLFNSTVVNNTAGSIGGGIYNFDGLLEIHHCTIMNNLAGQASGSGIASFGDAATRTVVGNSIVVGNADADVDYVLAGFNSFISNGHNLIGKGNAVGDFNQRRDETGVEDPRLAPLADFGGPTRTRPPLPGSPAIEGGQSDANTTGTDQRGQPRIAGQFPDIGAVEAFAFSRLPLVDTDGDGIDDRLEPAYGFEVGIDESGVDSDGDGQTDALELSNMTDPNNPASRFEIISAAPAAGEPGNDGAEFAIEFTSFPGLTYRIQTSNEATFSNPSEEPPVEAGGFQSQTLVEAIAPNAFFRVRRE